MAVLTFSRQYGCGGEYIAERVADRLGYRLVNKEMVKYSAILSGVSEKKAASFDEERHSRFRSFLSRFFDLDMFSEILSGKFDEEVPIPAGKQEQSLFDEYAYHGAVFDSESFQKVMERIIRGLADKGGVVFVGRGSQSLLGEHPKAVHFRLVAPLEDRIRWISSREELSQGEARKKIVDIDKRKARFLNRYYDADIDDPGLYHCVVNLARYSLDEATEAVLGATRARLGELPES